ncbi:MAG: carboxysome peptide B [Aphanocapsa feldmannii 277cV]|uniref:Carboxysome peptide B n=1 Tax=Aphanocapsa feldmannii 277cV TaxID=2507553 RepID=A0A524RKB9_9CHRO|nr:MAG: carboxysome peptide B [Aphanocapsa feldmannii 277cV]
MEIQQVVGSLVCTNRVPGLDHWHLRLIRNARGKVSVAVDPVGASPGNWVFTASGAAARFATGKAETHTDLTIGGIIDGWDPDG